MLPHSWQNASAFLASSLPSGMDIQNNVANPVISVNSAGTLFELQTTSRHEICKPEYSLD